MSRRAFAALAPNSRFERLRGFIVFHSCLLRCSDGTIYAGSCENLAERLATHNRGEGPTWAAKRRPVELIYSELPPHDRPATSPCPPRSPRPRRGNRDMAVLGISRNRLRQLVTAGGRQRIARGVYVAADHDLSEKHSLAVACALVPHGVVCLLSALVFHGLTVPNPWEAWLAIDPWARGAHPRHRDA